MGRFRDLLAEWKARRAGARYLSSDIRKSARHIVGPTGDMVSNAWDHLARDGERYLESFNPRIPPSLHVSQRDRTRWSMPIPLVERCVEDWDKYQGPADPSAEPPRAADDA